MDFRRDILETIGCPRPVLGWEGCLLRAIEYNVAPLTVRPDRSEP
jgi:hypothetical protein